MSSPDLFADSEARDPEGLELTAADTQTRESEGLEFTAADTQAHDLEGLEFVAADTQAREPEGLEFTAADTQARDLEGLEFTATYTQAREPEELELTVESKATKPEDSVFTVPVESEGTALTQVSFMIYIDFFLELWCCYLTNKVQYVFVSFIEDEIATL